MINLVSLTGATSIHHACSAGVDIPTLRLLLNHSGGIDSLCLKTLKGGTPLHWAAGSPSSKYLLIKTLLEHYQKHIDIDSKDENGLTPLLLSVASGHDDVSALLVKHGADRGMILAGNLTVYHIAADGNLLETLKALLEIDTCGINKLQDQSSKRNLTISERCCNIKNDQGETPLDLACQNGHLDCVMLLTGEDEKD